MHEIASAASAVAAVPYYRDWTFWSFAVALVALAFSTAPYLWRWLRPPKLEVELYDQIALSHKVGNPTLQAHFIVRNVGGREARVSSVTATLRRDGGAEYILPARTYLTAPSTPALLFTPFTLGPHGEWAQITNFFAGWDRETQQHYRELEYALKSNILQKLRQRAPGDNRNIAADAAVVTPLIAMFERNDKRWLPGQYELTLRVATTVPRVKAMLRYRFTVFESDSEELRKLTEDYQSGAGIYFDNVERHPWVYPSVTRA
ncbi:hypothetical protein [Paraburkholderia heleia]|uniref:hypothetical protein n=1 Tax=Paraburkholderia heleia TaxID=634127 RepID=UPI002AB63AFE|nr:hypothetical protein [Paraburkholderia heleia]